MITINKNELGWIDNTSKKHIALFKGKRYLLNRIIGNCNLAEAWGLFDGNYHLIPLDESALFLEDNNEA
jgi:hypothetical protein